MANRGTFHLIDRLLDGQLAALLGRWNAEGVSNYEIAQRLRDEHRVTVSAETVRRWVNDLAPDAKAV